MAVDVPGLVWSIARSLAIWTRVHADFLSADGAVIRTVARTNRTTHYTRVSLRTDQIIQATNPQKTASMTERMSLSTIDIIVQHNAHMANIPAKIVSITQPAKPMTLRKVLDTIVFIFLVLEFTPSLCVRRGCDRSVNYRPALRAFHRGLCTIRLFDLCVVLTTSEISTLCASLRKCFLSQHGRRVLRSGCSPVVALSPISCFWCNLNPSAVLPYLGKHGLGQKTIPDYLTTSLAATFSFAFTLSISDMLYIFFPP